MKLSDSLRVAAKMIDKGGIPVSNAILVWPGKEEFVPPEIWAIVDHDDLDWVSFVPDIYRDAYISWMETGCFDWDRKEYPGGMICERHHS